jgi:hypothetical protein
MIRTTTRTLAVLLTLCCCAFSSYAGKISGRITDDQGYALAYATILIEGTQLGATAGADGVYAMTLKPGKYTLLCRYTGYARSVFQVEIKGDEAITHNFKLKEQATELNAVVVKPGGEDPAYRIMRKAIKQRTYHLKQLQSFQTDVYVKGVLRNRQMPDKVMGIKIKEKDKKEMNGSMGLDSAGRGVMYLCEEVAEYYSAGPDKTRVIIKSVKESGDPNGVGLGNVPTVINFYENNVEAINGQSFVSPVSNTALNYYKYKLLGDFQENGTMVYKIRVTPKRAFERCFEGDIYIVDDVWAIHSLQMNVTKRSGLDMFDTVAIRQLYVSLDKDVWVIKNQVYFPTIKIFGFDLTASFVTVYDNQKVNVQIPDSIFNKRVTVSYDKDATKRDSSYWQSFRPVELEGDESRNYVYRDSVRKTDDDPARNDSLRRRANRVTVGEILFGGLNFNTKEYRTNFNVSPIWTDVNYNTVEGLNYAPAMRWRHRVDTGKILSGSLNLRYGFSNTHFNAKAGVQYGQYDRHWAGRSWSVKLTGGKYISQYNTAQPVPELFNTASALIFQRNYFKIFEKSFGALTFNRAYGNGFSWSLGASYEQRLPLENTTDYTWANKDNYLPFDSNLPAELAGVPWGKHDAAIVKGSISYSPGYTYTEYPDRKVPHAGKWPMFTLSYQKGISGLANSVVDYDKWRFNIKDDVDLKRWGSLDYNVAAGGFLNDRYVSIPDMIHLNGNQFVITPSYLNGFQLAPYYRFSNVSKLYGEAHVEYYLKGLLTNKLPLLRQAHWYFVLGNNTFYGDHDMYYTEAFVGIDNLGWSIFRVFRFDYVHGWDSNKETYSGFRIGIHTSGMTKVAEKNDD